jgi:hypothetical protein
VLVSVEDRSMVCAEILEVQVESCFDPVGDNVSVSAR